AKFNPPRRISPLGASAAATRAGRPAASSISASRVIRATFRRLAHERARPAVTAGALLHSRGGGGAPPPEQQAFPLLQFHFSRVYAASDDPVRVLRLSGGPVDRAAGILRRIHRIG